MGTLLIKGARLETGFIDQDQGPTETETREFDLLIGGGQFLKIEEEIHESEAAEVLEAGGRLLLPSFREMHIHVDKTYFSGPWKACKPNEKGVLTRIEEEEKLLPAQLPFAEERAKAVIAHYISQGHTHIRSHCNIDPQIELKHLEITKRAFAAFEGQVTYDIVAFPQHGLLRSGVEGLMREAMEKGASLVGGVDPATIDRNIHQSLKTMFSIAREAGTGLDIHIHDPDTLGEFTFYQLIEETHRHHLEGRVTISHANALAGLDEESLADMMQALKAAGIDISSTVPITSRTIPILDLDQAGIPVSLGHDSLTDHWSPFGTGNTIEKLGRLGHRFNVIDERGMHDLLKFATGGKTPLNAAGEQVWPQVGQGADAILVEASCTPEMIARRKPVHTVLSKGRLIFNAGEGRDRDE